MGMRAAIVAVGGDDANMDATIDSLNRQSHGDWVAASFPEVAEPTSFDPQQVREFLENDAADFDFVVFGLIGTTLRPNALQQIAAAFLKFPEASAVYSDVDVMGSDHSTWPLAFSAFDYERSLEQGYCAHLFALRRVWIDRALD